MDKLVKRGLWCMVGAVFLMPVAFLFKATNQDVTVFVLVLSMVLELIGLVFVIVHILKRRKK